MSLEFLMDHFAYFERFGNWKWLKVPVVGAGASEVGALFAQVDWAHVWPIVGLAITAVGTALIGLYRYYKLTQIEIEAARRKAGLESLVVTVAPGVTATVPGTNPNVNMGSGVAASPGTTGNSTPQPEPTP